jgi:hypothetical protein
MFEQVPDCDWTDAIRAGDFNRAWCISDRSLREYCASGAAKHAGERHHQRIWRGERLAGQRVLVRCYHGLGDTIQFIRFAKPLREIAREVNVWGQPDLVPLLRNVAGVDSVLPLHDGSPAVAYDVDIEIMELAHALRVSPELVSNSVPYLPRPNRPEHPMPHAPLSIGLIWEASNWDRRRCVPPHLLGLLASEAGARLFSLQLGPARQAAPSIPAKDIAVGDIEKLARLIEKVDLIVTVDTMMAHLAGALGASVWTMLHADCDWRWPAKGHESLWYPTMKLFHQQVAGDWTTVIEEIVEGLKQYRTSDIADLGQPRARRVGSNVGTRIALGNACSNA